MADHHANIKDMDGINTDKLFEAMEVEFEDVMNQESNENVQFNTECLIGLSNMDYAEKVMQPSEIRALNIRIKHCIICCYYTTYDDISALCAACIIYLWR